MVAELEEARALGELLQAGLAAEAHDRLRRLGRRGAGAARLDRVGRGARRRAARARGRLHQQRRQRPRLPQRERVALARAASSTTWRATSTIRRRSVSVWKRRQARTIARGTGRRAQRARATRADLRIGALGSGSDYTPFLQHLGIAVAQPRLRRRGRRRHLPLDLRRLLPLHAFLDTDFVYGRALAQTVGTAVIRLADARCAAVRVHRSRRHGADVREGAADAARSSSRTTCASATGRSTTACSRRSPIRVGRVPAPQAGGGAAGAQLRAARERRRRR